MWKDPQRNRVIRIVLVLSEAVLLIVIGLTKMTFRRIHSCCARMEWLSSITLTSTSTNNFSMELSNFASPPGKAGIF